MTAEEPEVFRFRYSVFTVDARIVNGQLVAKTGMRTAVAPIARLQHLYVDDTEGSDHLELILSYAHKSGRLKRARIFSDPGEPGFHQLVASLLARRPEIDIRGIAVGDAYTKMGSKQLEWAVIPMIMATATLVVGLTFTPMLMHGLDSGETTIELSEAMDSTKPASKNLVLSGGKLLIEKSLRESTEYEARTGFFAAWIPLVPANWQTDDPVQIILEFRALDGDQAQALATQSEFRGILRDIWWEGLDGKRRRELIGKGLRLHKEVWLVEHGVRARDDLFLVIMVIGFLSLIMFGVSINLWLKRQK